MKLKNIIILFIFIMTIFMINNVSNAVIAGNRDIILNISNVENIDDIEIYTLYPIDYIEYKYFDFLNNKDLMEFYKNKKEILNKMKEALEKQEYLEVIKLDEFNIFDTIFDEKYIKYRDKVYIKGTISPNYLNKENFKNIMLYSGKEYDENTIAIPFFVDYNYEKLDFKFLLVEGENEKILSVNEYEYDELNERGVTDYELMVEQKYDEIDIVIMKEESIYSNFYDIVRAYRIDDNGNIIEYDGSKDDVFEENIEETNNVEEEKSIGDILFDNLHIIAIVFSILNIILIVILVKKKKKDN